MFFPLEEIGTQAGEAYTSGIYSTGRFEKFWKKTNFRKMNGKRHVIIAEIETNLRWASFANKIHTFATLDFL